MWCWPEGQKNRFKSCQKKRTIQIFCYEQHHVETEKQGAKSKSCVTSAVSSKEKEDMLEVKKVGRTFEKDNMFDNGRVITEKE